MEFKKLHYQDKPLIIANIWDVPSVKTAEQLNFQAVGTSSSAIASLLGYNDGEEMEFSEMEYFIKRISLNTKLPLSVDLESGYSRNPNEIVNNIKRLADLGVVGINVEDSIIKEKRIIFTAEEFAKTISYIKNTLEKRNINIFLNIRTDTFLLQQKDVVKETQKRIKLYQDSGADGIFIPCIVNENDIKAIVNSTNLPINVMCMPKLPTFKVLEKLGVKRISMGNFLFETMYKQLKNATEVIMNQESFKSIF